jgi:hypothetical protein
LGNTCPPGGCACRSAMLENVLIKELPRPKTQAGEGLYSKGSHGLPRKKGGGSTHPLRRTVDAEDYPGWGWGWYCIPYFPPSVPTSIIRTSEESLPQYFQHRSVRAPCVRACSPAFRFQKFQTGADKQPHPNCGPSGQVMMLSLSLSSFPSLVGSQGLVLSAHERNTYLQ